MSVRKNKELSLCSGRNNNTEFKKVQIVLPDLENNKAVGNWWPEYVPVSFDAALKLLLG